MQEDKTLATLTDEEGYDLQVSASPDGCVTAQVFRPGAYTSRYAVLLTLHQQYELMLTLADNLRRHQPERQP